MRKICFIILLIFLFSSPALADTVTVNVSETNLNSTVFFNGTGFLANTNYSLDIFLENQSAWWDGYNEQWNMPITNITTDADGNFNLTWKIPVDFRISEGLQTIKVGQMIHSALYWSTQGTNWTAVLPTKNGITGDNGTDGYVYTGSNTAASGIGGIEKFSKNNGTFACRFNMTSIVNVNSLVNNGTYVYAVTSGTSGNLIMMNMTDCKQVVNITTAGAAAWSVNIAPDNSYIIITYAASTAPRMYNITNMTPVLYGPFNKTAFAFIAYDTCISPDSNVTYIGYANGNVTALNKSGNITWNSNPHQMSLGQSGAYQFQINGISCDNERVYVARSAVTVSGVVNQGFIDALNASNGSLIWTVSKTNTVYDGANVNDIKCDNDFCYAIKDRPTISTGVASSTLWQINKTTGQVAWWN